MHLNKKNWFLLLNFSNVTLLFCVAYYLPQNAGDIARKYMKDPQLLSFIDAEVQYSNSTPSFDFISFGYLQSLTVSKDVLSVVFLQCFIVSTVNALQTPMINAAMVRSLNNF